MLPKLTDKQAEELKDRVGKGVVIQYGPINDGMSALNVENAMRETCKINADDTTHQVIIGKTRDGMSGFTKNIPSKSGASRATGLLAGLMHRI